MAPGSRERGGRFDARALRHRTTAALHRRRSSAPAVSTRGQRRASGGLYASVGVVMQSTDTEDRQRGRGERRRRRQRRVKHSRRLARHVCGSLVRHLPPRAPARSTSHAHRRWQSPAAPTRRRPLRHCESRARHARRPGYSPSGASRIVGLRIIPQRRRPALPCLSPLQLSPS